MGVVLPLFSMAVFLHVKHNEYEFVGCVPAYLYCKLCKLVARRLTLTSCCGESYCHACIADTREQGKSCPACGERDFDLFEHKKNQKHINSLQVYCNFKERGCAWYGPLEQLDTHLDPFQDNCQYVDTKCPLNCHMIILKNKVDQHIAAECTKRPYVCQHCNFNATYEEVVNIHLPECKYVPLDCPNRCGVTCDREDMEDHMKICRLEVIACHFKGCSSRFKREDLEEHFKQNGERHLALTASLVVKVENDLHEGIEKQEQKLEEQGMRLLCQEKCHQEEVKALKQIIIDQGKRLEQMDLRLLEEREHRKQVKGLEQKIQELETRLVSQNGEYQVQQLKLKNILKEHEKQLQYFDKEHKEEKQKLLQLLEDQGKKICTMSAEHKNEEQKLRLMFQNQVKMYRVQERGLEEMKKQLEQKMKEFESKQNDVKHCLEQKLATNLQRLEQVQVLLCQNEDKISNVFSQVIPDQDRQLRVVRCSLEEMFTSASQGVQQVKVLLGQSEDKISTLNELVILKHKFCMENFTALKEVNSPGEWKSPPMYTHLGGYKFCIGVDVNRNDPEYGRYMDVYVCSMPGEYDNTLKWPAQVSFKVELINQQRGRNMVSSADTSWLRSRNVEKVISLFHPSRHTIYAKRILSGLPVSHNSHFLQHSELDDFLVNDSLHFIVSNVDAK